MESVKKGKSLPQNIDDIFFKEGAFLSNEYELGADKSYYVLTADIVINDVTNYENWEKEAPQYGWEPINSFQGNFNGNGHSITGLYCFVSGEDSTVGGGLFDTISGGIVENLILDKAMVIRLTTAQYAGILASSIYDGEVYNCQVSGIVKGSRCGGVIGSTSWSVVDGCSFDGEIRGEQGGYCGGIIGSASGVIVSNCNNKGAIASTDEKDINVGGIVGSFSATAMGFSLDEETYPEEAAKTEAWIQSVKGKGVGIKNCINQGQVQAKKGGAGGILGGANIKKGTIIFENCSDTGVIMAELEERGGFDTTVGGIAGTISIFEESHLQFENCLAESEISTKEVAFVGGMVGSITVAESNEGELTCILNNCQSNSSLTVDDYATCGSICGSFMKGVQKDDFAGKIEVKNCTSTSELPEFGTAGSIVDYLEAAYIEALENEKKMEAGE